MGLGTWIKNKLSRSEAKWRIGGEFEPYKGDIPRAARELVEDYKREGFESFIDRIGPADKPKKFLVKYKPGSDKSQAKMEAGLHSGLYHHNLGIEIEKTDDVRKAKVEARKRTARLSKNGRIYIPRGLSSSLDKYVDSQVDVLCGEPTGKAREAAEETFRSSKPLIRYAKSQGIIDPSTPEE